MALGSGEAELCAACHGSRQALGMLSMARDLSHDRMILALEVDAKAVLRFVELTDDKRKFRQWDLKFANALTHVEKEYGWAMKRIKECIDAGGDDEEDVRIMLALADGSALGPSGLDVDQLAADLEYILVDKAKVGSDILHRIHNAMPRGAS